METWEWIVLAAAAAALVLLVIAFFSVRRRRSHLKERFGPEYYRAVSSSGVGGGEKQLRETQRTHDDIELRALPNAARDRYLEEWRQLEIRFVSDPREAARSAERLVERVLEERGYPREDDPERRVSLVAVDHPEVAERYRHGHAMLENVDGSQSTENLRKAMIDFRAVLEEVLQGRQDSA